jgi:hypothetical protein
MEISIVLRSFPGEAPELSDIMSVPRRRHLRVRR